MADVRYIGLERLQDYEVAALTGVVNHHMTFFEEKIPKLKLTVAVKKSKVLGRVGRFDMNFSIDSPQGKFHVEQSGWGIVKTAHRCGEHMHNLLEHRIRKELLEHKPRKTRR